MPGLIDDGLTLLGIKATTVGGSLIGAIVSLRFLAPMPGWAKLFSVLSGAFFAAYVTPLASELFNLSTRVESAVAFLIGLFGLAFASAVFTAIPGIIDAAKQRIFR